MFDGYAGWDPEARFKLRVVCARPYHALFMHNMLIRWVGGRVGGWVGGRVGSVLWECGLDGRNCVVVW